MSGRSHLEAVFSELVGQAGAISLLVSAIERDHVAPAYLFAGPEGVGRKRAAECFAQLVLADRPELAAGMARRVHERMHPDLIWLEPTYTDRGQLIPASQAQVAGLEKKTPPQIRLEQIRQLAANLGRPPIEAQRSFVVIEGAETMAEGAANALLKTLEEPGRATIILLAPGPEALLPTLVSRCARVVFRRLAPEELLQVLDRAGQGHLRDQPEVLALAQGCPGQAIAHWQRLQSLPPELLDRLRQPPSTVYQALDLARQIDKTTDTDQQHWLVNYLQQTWWQPADGLTASRLQRDRWLRRLETLRHQLLGYVQPRLAWEVALMDLAETP
jgi:DNA polymerase-3 subunit delta'